jgi:hypothetical protein
MEQERYDMEEKLREVRRDDRLPLRPKQRVKKLVPDEAGNGHGE